MKPTNPDRPSARGARALGSASTLFGDADRAALALTAALWFVHFLMMTARLGGKDLDHWAQYLLSRLALSLCGATLTLVLYLFLRRRRASPFFRQAMSAALLSAAAASAMALVNIHGFGDLSPAWEARSYYLLLVQAFMYWYWFYLSWSTAYLALSYSFSVTEQERRAAALGARAHEAQMQALRYQVQPHFLFNALNSIASLIAERPEQAEAMVVKLSDLLRSSLLADPHCDISLSEELGLQAKYLEIERIRFPDRLSVEIEVPRELADARIPCLLLQPLVENAVKHGVAPTDRKTRLRIEARMHGDNILIKVVNDLPPRSAHGRDTSGTGIGLANVRRRLEARYGGDHILKVSEADCLFIVEIAIPRA